jgi:probable phosphoglycerate mutase
LRPQPTSNRKGPSVPIIVLARHGVTDATGSRLGGHTDASLNDRGRTQAEEAAAALAEYDVQAVYTSPIVRTRETATILARPHGLFPTTARGLIEVDYGDWTDRPLKELRDEELWSVIQRAPSRVRFPGGGTIRGMQAAAVEGIEQIAARHEDGEVVIAVSHADVIKAILAHHLGTGLDDFQRIVVGPASLSVLLLPEGRSSTVLAMNVRGAVDLPRPSGDGEGGDQDVDTGTDADDG